MHVYMCAYGQQIFVWLPLERKHQSTNRTNCMEPITTYGHHLEVTGTDVNLKAAGKKHLDATESQGAQNKTKGNN